MFNVYCANKQTPDVDPNYQVKLVRHILYMIPKAKEFLQWKEWIWASSTSSCLLQNMI